MIEQWYAWFLWCVWKGLLLTAVIVQSAALVKRLASAKENGQ